MGSLFKARDFWSTKCGNGEEYDKKSLVVANIDNDQNGSEKIIVGSFSGILRVFYPKQKGFNADDLLLEQELEMPILQLAAGQFLPNSGAIALAVLHPRKLAVYVISRAGGTTEGTDPLAKQYTVAKQYEHWMERTSYNMCYGPFGSVYGKDFLCVQSMDGQLQFFEQDKLIFARFLHNFLVPGHLCYCQKIDSFITNTSTFEVECYKYQTLASSYGSEEKTNDKDNEPQQEEQPKSSGKRVSVTWSVNIGEDVVDIRTARYSNGLAPGEVDILVLGERHLYCIKEQGQIRMQKRLDYFSSCLTPFPIKKEGNADAKQSHMIVGTYSNSIQIFSDTKLLWAAKTQHTPMAIEIATVAKTEGMIVMLGHDGLLSINYLGTDPASNPVQILESKELDYEEMDDEHRRLQALIRQAVNAGKAEPKEQVLLKTQIPAQLDSQNQIQEMYTDISPNTKGVTVVLTLSYSGDEDIENAVMTVSVPSPFQLQEHSILLPALPGAGAEGIELPLFFYLPEPVGNSNPLIPTSLSTTCLVAYTNPNGEPLTTKLTFLLPLPLAGCVIPPVKNPTYKITIDTNRAPLLLQVLFEDITTGKGELSSAGNVLSFQYHNTNSDVTILVSKNAGRYRVQSGSFEALWLFTSELVRRLKLYFGEGGPGAGADADGQEEPFFLSYTENLPFQEYFQTIDNHFKGRQRLTNSQQILSERAHQFRSIQKRLLVRFKDRNPSPLSNLDNLFEDTYRHLIRIADSVEEEQAALAQAANSLTCATNLMLLLIRYRFQMKKDEFKQLQYYLSPVVVDSQTQGWEECTDAAMTHLLRTCLAKNARESSSMPQPLQVPSDINKLKKHIALVCDRLSKGGSLRMEGNKKK
eukprot:TRINITY_DN61798_c0_g1_i1.p1 TRINITY_DN61798_c0_g1~~TRINITY_DN61798_c0_g1_i1.p1  ORF type:complete len:865 (-),score=120.59 TRINITY_DN61798_c0_g1_i1:1500-4094(-)